MPIQLDAIHLALGAAALFLGLAAAVAYAGLRKARRRAEALEDEVRRMRSKPEKHELRLDRFDLVWFPTVTVSPGTMEITGVAPGVPHCRACVSPLSLGRGEWSCSLCNAKFPESLADLMVSDSITQEALKYFQQRHKGYRLAIKK